MKTKYLLSSMFATAMLFVVDVSAMHQRYSQDLPDYSSREQSPADFFPDQQGVAVETLVVKEEPDEHGNGVEAITPVVLPGGEDRENPLDVDALNAQIADLEKRSKEIKKELSSTKGVSTRRARQVEELKQQLAEVTNKMNKKVTALAKALKESQEKGSSLVSKAAALQEVIETMKKQMSDLEQVIQNQKEQLEAAQKANKSSWVPGFLRRRPQPAANYMYFVKL